MLNFFDYFYYKVCIFYLKSGDSSARIGALCVVTLFQFLNLFSIFAIISLALNGFIKNGKVIGIVLAIGLLICNGFRYNRLNFDVLKEKWQNEKSTFSNKKKLFIAVYIVVSVLVVISLIFRNQA